MLPDRLRAAVGSQIAAVTHGDVVIDLKIFAAVGIDETVDDLSAVFPNFRIPEIQQVTLVVDVALAVAADKPVIRQPARKLAGDAHHFDFEPHTHFQALASRVIEHLPKSVREPFRAFHPFADAVPPVALVVPAAVHAVVLASDLGGFVDDLHFRVFVGITHQAVHVIIEHDEEADAVIVGAADRPPVPCQGADGFIDSSVHDAESNGDRPVFISRLQRVPPAVFSLRRPAQRQEQTAAKVGTVLHMPLSRVFDLEAPGCAGLTVAYQSHRKKVHRRPGAFSVVAEFVHAGSRGVIAAGQHAAQVQFPGIAFLPAGFAAPAVPGNIDVGFFGIGELSFTADVLEHKGRHILQRNSLISFVLQHCPDLDHGYAAEELHMIARGHAVV